MRYIGKTACILPIPIIYIVYYPVILNFYICTCQKKAVLLRPQKFRNMRKISLIGFLLAAVMAVSAEEYSLTYQGFPYMKTACENPTYAAGTIVKLSSGRPKISGKWLEAWVYNNVEYQPGDSFVMPAEDVVLVPKMKDVGEGIETVESQKSRVKSYKILRDGQLLIVRDGVEYNIIGVRVK